MSSSQDEPLNQTQRIVRWSSLAVLVMLGLLIWFIPSWHEGVAYAISLLSSGNLDAVKDLIRSFGPWAAALSFLLMVLQSLAAPIPAFLITFANASVFGWWQGALLSWTSAMAGAALCFWIARALGAGAVAHFMSSSAQAQMNKFFARFGGKTILICRLLPFISFDYVSYAAGLTPVGFGKFMLATGLGQLPATLVYSYVGGMLTGGVKYLFIGICVLTAIFVLIWVLKQFFSARHAELMTPAQQSDTKAPRE